MKINILGIVKGVTELAVSAGVGVVVGNVVKATTPYDLNKFQRIIVGIGAYGLGGVLGDLSAKYISSEIDGYAERVKNLIHPSEEVEDAIQDFKEAVVETVQAGGEVAEAVVTDIKKAHDPDSITNEGL